MNEKRPPIDGYRLTWQILGGLALGFLVLALAFPFFVQGNPPSHKRSCLSQSKQIATGAMIYSSDNNDGVPPCFSFDGAQSQAAFVTSLEPYTKNRMLFLCPEEQKNGSPGGQEGLPGKIDYVHCLSLRGVIPNFSEGKRFLSWTKIKDPAVVPYFRDPIRGYGTAKDNSNIGFLSPHGGGFNTAFLDTHVKYVKSPNINSDL